MANNLFKSTRIFRVDGRLGLQNKPVTSLHRRNNSVTSEGKFSATVSARCARVCFVT